MPSSETATMPASRISATGAMRSPLEFSEMAPTGKTFTGDCCRAISMMKCVTAALSLTGCVFGIASTEVNTPAAAALPPLSIVSAYHAENSTCCFLCPSRILARRTAQQQVQHGHAHGDAVFHLVQDHGARK